VDAATYCTRAAKKRRVIFSAHGANSERPAPALRHEGQTRARVDRQHPWSDLSARFHRALSYPVFSSVNKLSDTASLAKVPYFQRGYLNTNNISKTEPPRLYIDIKNNISMTQPPCHQN
jgi:hypothetical protein